MEVGKDAIMDHIWTKIAVTIVAYYASLALYRLFLHPLAQFPGPKLAAISRYYEAYYDLILSGQYTPKIAELHKQYGILTSEGPSLLSPASILLT